MPGLPALISGAALTLITQTQPIHVRGAHTVGVHIHVLSAMDTGCGDGGLENTELFLCCFHDHALGNLPPPRFLAGEAIDAFLSLFLFLLHTEKCLHSFCANLLLDWLVFARALTKD